MFWKKKKNVEESIDEKIQKVLNQDPQKLSGYDRTRFDLMSFLTQRGAKINDYEMILNAPGGKYTISVKFNYQGRDGIINLRVLSEIIDGLFWDGRRYSENESYGPGTLLTNKLDKFFKQINKQEVRHA